jgi:hypothetical protein
LYFGKPILQIFYLYTNPKQKQRIIMSSRASVFW